MSVDYLKTQWGINMLKLRNRLDKFMLEFRNYYLIFIGLLLLFNGYIASLSGILYWTNNIAIIVSSLLLFREVKNIRKKTWDYLYLTKYYETDKLKFSDKYDDLGYKFIKKVEKEKKIAIYSKDINNRLLNSKLEYSLEKKEFVVPFEAQRIRAFVINDKKGICTNDKKIKLCSESFRCDKKIKLMYTDYFSSECTNEIASSKIGPKSNDSNEIVFEGPKLWVDDNIILDLKKSKCSNHIGISTIAITKDSCLLLIYQSKDSAQSSNKLVSSGSGSAEREDLIATTNNFSKFITDAMERELLQEIGFGNVKKEDRLKYIKKTKIIGFSRLLDRGGKPEFFGFTILNVLSKDCKPKGKEELFVSKIKKVDVKLKESKNFVDRLNRYLDNDVDISISLFLNIKFLIDFIENNEKDYKELVELLDFDLNKSLKK